MNYSIFDLRKKYKWLVAWNKYLRSMDHYIDKQVRIAGDNNAPVDAIYKKDNNTWVTANSDDKKKLQPFLDE